MTRLVRYLILPREVTPFEARYLRKMNKVALAFFWLHPPAFAIVALLAGTSVGVALGLSLATMIGPTLAYFAFAARPRVVSMVYGFTAMLMGGALVYIGQGPMQIEMHFYFFVLIALLSVFGNPAVILIAAVTVAAHHLVVFFLVPTAVFNYEASFWAVLIHAIFVVLESVAACFVARSFFDNVIGLETIVTHRTRALDARNHDMARILDNVGQGFVSVDLDGRMRAEWSRALARWFGEPAPGASICSYLAGHAPDVEAWMQLGFEGLRDDFMPFEVVIDQFPRQISRDDHSFRIEYLPIGEPPTALLLVVSDITDELAGHQAESVQRELIAVVERAFRDRGGFMAFLEEADDLVRQCATPQDEPVSELKRRLHTLKGNTAMFGVTSIATLCHELEASVEDQGVSLEPANRARLAESWRAFRERIARILGISDRRMVQVDWDEYQTVTTALAREPESAWATMVRSWGKTPTRPRLEQFADYARALSLRLGKGELDVSITDHDLRIPNEQLVGVWSALVHTIRNSIDHGIEPVERRLAVRKPAQGHLHFETRLTGEELWIEVADDGGGIDWPQVRERALALGLAVATQADLDEAVFTEGVSTTKVVNETSGRGVGMGALRSVCWELGGRVEIASSKAGTRVSCVLPISRRTRKTSVRPYQSIAP